MATIKEEYLSEIGAHYIPLIVLDLLRKSLEIYKKRKHTKRNFQVSVAENTYSTASIVLIVLSIESFGNRIYCLEHKKPGKIYEDLGNIIQKNAPGFPGNGFKNILEEMFILRDVIVHNHIYKIKCAIDENNGALKSYRQEILPGYGDGKFKGNINSRTKLTKLLRFNIQPTKIGFEDIFKALIIFDLFVGVCQKTTEKYNYYVPFHVSQLINNSWERGLSKILTYYYDQIPNKKYQNKISVLVRELNNLYSNFVPANNVLTNLCPKCSTFGVDKPGGIFKCKRCKYPRAYTLY